MMTIVLSLDFRWPKQVEEFFRIASPITEITTQIISIDCFIDNRESNDDVPDFPMIYVYKIMYALMPIILVIAGTIFWEQYFYWEDRKVAKARQKQDEENSEKEEDVKEKALKVQKREEL